MSLDSDDMADKIGLTGGLPFGADVPIRNAIIAEGVMHGWRRWARILSALACLCMACGLAGQPAHADGSVSSLGMGYGAPNAYVFAQFQSVIQQYNASGERFRIDSHCQSACTMFLSIRHVCVTPGATLLFHAGGNRVEVANSGARLILAPDWKPIVWTEEERKKGQAWGLKTIESFHTHGTPPVSHLEG